jgi:ribosomal protein L16 Arg81 hydroxylase
MAEDILDRLLDPVGREAFFADTFGKSWLHVPGGPERVSDIMSLDILSSLLSMTSVWTAQSMRVYVDREAVPVEDYCSPALSQTGQQVMRPDPEKVQSWIGRGASLALNDVDTLTPGIAAIANALQTATGGKAQTNLYFSMRQRQAFGPHHDTHEVFALHCCGEKTWNLYKNRADAPVAHPAYKKSFEAYEAEAGPVERQVTMKPGDLLYLPRGQYHDALADSDGSVHLTFGVTMPKLLDLMPMVWEAAVTSPAVRADLPVKPDAQALEKSLAALADELRNLVTSTNFRQQAARNLENFVYQHGSYDLARALKAERVDRVRRGLTILRKHGKSILTGHQRGVDIPSGLEPQVAWVLERDSFSDRELGEAFPAMPAPARGELIKNLAGMNVLA